MCFEMTTDKDKSKSKGSDMTVPEVEVHGRRSEIVDELILAGELGRSSRELAEALDAPIPSVRRDLGTLRAKGYDIRYDESNGVFILN